MAATIQCVDLFCGAGGSSSGLYSACRDLGITPKLTAINHWPVAIATHAANHPDAVHLCESINNLNPRKVCTGKLDLLIGSPECTHHSIARGGKPCSDQSRAGAWQMVHWCEALSPNAVLVENVKEFATWGPLDAKDRPTKSGKGKTFQAWIDALRSLGYSVGYRVLNAADYGDATTRERLFVQALRGRKKIVWPEPTHTKKTDRDLFGDMHLWKPAREIIDWTIQGKSIFGRKKPLAQATMARIEAGIRKFCGDRNEAFIIHVTHTGSDRARSINSPIPTITTAKGGEMALVEPFVIGQQSGAVPRSVSNPLPTISTAGAISLVEPFIVKYYGNGGEKPVSQPLDTISTRDRFGLVQVDGSEVDIRFRMLQPHELAAAMSFPDGYQFSGTREAQVKQIGNAVPVRTAAAIIKSILKP